MTTTKTTGALIITSSNVNGLINNELKENVMVMLKSAQEQNGSMWKYAIAVNNIVQADLFKDDYESLTKFAKAIDSTKSTLSKYSNDVILMNHLMENYGYSMEVMHITKVSELLGIQERIDEFMEFIGGKDLQRMPRAEIRKLVKEFKGDEPEKEKVEEVTSESNETNETNETDENVYVKCIEDEDGLHIYYNEREYLIPFKKLDKYLIG